MQFKDRYGNIRTGNGKEFHEETNYILQHGFVTKPEPPAPSSKGFSYVDAQRKYREMTGASLVEDRRTPEQRMADAVAREVAKQVKPLVEAVKQQQKPEPVSQEPASHSKYHSPYMSDDAFEKLYELGKYRKPTSEKQSVKPQSVTHAAGELHQRVTDKIVNIPH